jgi:uncharacterized protein
MESGSEPQLPDQPVPHSPAEGVSIQPHVESDDIHEIFRALRRIFVGGRGLRAGWSVAIFLPLFILIASLVSLAFRRLHAAPDASHLSAQAAFFGELAAFIGMVVAAWVVALIERRSLFDYYLRGPGRVSRFAIGLITGFAALSLLVGSLHLGGWLFFGPAELSGRDILSYAALWGLAFLTVGCVEEGIMRCFLLFTLARGINFWWAIGLVGAMCADLLILGKGEGIWGVYAMAAIGLVPCLVLYLNKSQGAGFWYSAWVTSTFFGFGHTSNNGENWIGIFAAGAIGFVFCVSVKVTGSAWWAIGCHAAWDWAETYFYGTADSGMVAMGHYLTTSPAGSAFWSGGTDGPEGSVLVLGVIAVLLLAVLALYGRRRAVEVPVPTLEQTAS